jgi:hypothetical protein
MQNSNIKKATKNILANRLLMQVPLSLLLSVYEHTLRAFFCNSVRIAKAAFPAAFLAGVVMRPCAATLCPAV